MKYNFAIDKSAINVNWTDEQKMEVLTNAILGAPSLDLFRKVPNVKGNFTVNTFDSMPAIQAGSCGFNANGDVKLSQRLCEPADMKVNMSWCEHDLLKTFAEYGVNITAGQEDLDLNTRFQENISKHIAEQMEKLIWNGNKTSGDFIDGYLTILQKTAESALVHNVTYNANDMVATVNAVYLAIPENILNEAVVYVGQDDFRQYVLELGSRNLYFYNPVINEGMQFTIPNTTTTIKAVPGLNGKNKIVACRPTDFVYGFDNEMGHETVDFWYSKDAQEFRLAAKWMSGVQIAFPENVVLAK